MKHKAVQYKKGYWNYRGYNIVACGKGRWTISNEDDSLAAETKTLCAMKHKLDGWERKAAREANKTVSRRSPENSTGGA
jgi:hypothetical protein